MNRPSGVPLVEADDPRRLPPTPWMGHTGREQRATLSPALVVLRAVHHWHVIDRVSLQAITGYSQATIRWATDKLIASKQITDLGYPKGGYGSKLNSRYLVPFRNGPKRPSLPFFHPVKTTYLRSASDADLPGSLVKIGDAAVQFHTIMVPKAVAWIMGRGGLRHRTVPLPEYVLRKEFGWYSERVEELDKDDKDGEMGVFSKRRMVKTALPDAYLVAHRFAIRVEFELHRKTFDRYEAIFNQTHHGDLIFFIIYRSESLYNTIRNFVEDKGLPVCPIRWRNQEDLDTALRKLEKVRSDSVWLPSRYRSGIVAVYAPATLDPSLHDELPKGLTSTFFP